MSSTYDVLEEVRQERKTHPGRGWTAERDDTLRLSDWILKLESKTAEVSAWPEVDARKAFIEIAALSVAAVESIDRRGTEW